MDRYVYIQSDDSDEYFKDNKPFNFKIHLKYPLLMPGMWKVGMTAFFTNIDGKTKQSRETLCVYCNFCEESIVKGQLQKLLRHVPITKQGKWEHMFQNVYYIPVSRKEIFEMEFYIRTTDGSFASFLNKPVSIEIHFKPYPFLF